eukprot:s3145_g2.t1
MLSLLACSASTSLSTSYQAESVAPCQVVLAQALVPIGHGIMRKSQVWIGGSAIFAAMVIFLPIGPLDKFIHARVDTFLLCYDAGKGSDLVFWQNVLQVLVNFPLLAANWLAVEASGCKGAQDQAELEAASSVILVGLVLLVLMCAYFLLIEPCKSRDRLQQLVDDALGPLPAKAAD